MNLISSLLVISIFINCIGVTISQNYAFHVTRTKTVDKYRGDGFKINLCPKRLREGKNRCICPLNKLFVLVPSNPDKPDENVYHCAKNLSFGKRRYTLLNTTRTPTFGYKNGRWTISGSTTIIASRNGKRTIPCQKMKIKKVLRMGYFDMEEMKQHDFTLQQIKKQKTTKLLIDKKATKSQYQGHVIKVEIECKKKMFSLVIKFEGDRTLSGVAKPFIIAQPTKKPIEETQDTSEPKRDNLPIIIGASVGGAGLLLIFIVILVFLCILRNPKTIVVESPRRVRSSSAPPAYPGLDMPPSYELPIKPSLFSHSQETLHRIPRRSTTPLPPTPDRLPSFLQSDDETYEVPMKQSDETYETLYLKMVDIEEDLEGNYETTSMENELNNSEAESGCTAAVHSIHIIKENEISETSTEESKSPLYRVLEGNEQFTKDNVQSDLTPQVDSNVTEEQI